MNVRIALITAALFLGACGHSGKIVVNGIVVYESIWNQTVAEIAPQAEQDMGCPYSALEILLVRRAGRTPSELMINGCGARAYYSRVIVGPVRGGWRLTGMEGGAVQQMPNPNGPVIVIQQ